MAKSQKRSSREAKKPKSAKKLAVVETRSFITPPRPTPKAAGDSR